MLRLAFGITAFFSFQHLLAHIYLLSPAIQLSMYLGRERSLSRILLNIRSLSLWIGGTLHLSALSLFRPVCLSPCLPLSPSATTVCIISYIRTCCLHLLRCSCITHRHDSDSDWSLTIAFVNGAAAAAAAATSLRCHARVQQYRTTY